MHRHKSDNRCLALEEHHMKLEAQDRSHALKMKKSEVDEHEAMEATLFSFDKILAK